MVKDRKVELKLAARKRRADRRNAGLCTVCGGKIEDTKFKNCVKCRHGNWKSAELYRETEKYIRNSSRSVKNWNLKRTFNITLEEYFQLLKEQNGVCKICGRTPEENGKALAVDHDRRCCESKTYCGKCIRSLLCDRCNRGLGHFLDDIEYLRSVVAYLEIYD
jgi:hypothetical protein